MLQHPLRVCLGLCKRHHRCLPQAPRSFQFWHTLIKQGGQEISRDEKQIFNSNHYSGVGDGSLKTNSTAVAITDYFELEIHQLIAEFLFLHKIRINMSICYIWASAFIHYHTPHDDKDVRETVTRRSLLPLCIRLESFPQTHFYGGL